MESKLLGIPTEVPVVVRAEASIPVVERAGAKPRSHREPNDDRPVDVGHEALLASSIRIKPAASREQLFNRRIGQCQSPSGRRRYFL